MSDQATVTATPTVFSAETEGEARKLASFSIRPEMEIAGSKMQPFSAMRKAMLQITGNELLSMETHLKDYCRVHGREIPKDGDPDLAETMMAAIPEAAFHITALAFICVSDPKTLSRASADLCVWREVVMEFWDKLTEAQWTNITSEAFRLLGESNVTNDYTVKEEAGGAPAPKNG